MRGGWGLFVLGSVIIFFDWLMYLLQLGVHWDILYQFRKNRRRSSYQTIKATNILASADDRKQRIDQVTLELSKLSK